MRHLRYTPEEGEAVLSLFEREGVRTMAAFQQFSAEELKEELLLPNMANLSRGLRKCLMAIHADALQASASSPTAARKHGNTRCVVTSPFAECVVSSGGSVIASCDFTDGLSTVHRGLKVKLSKDCDLLMRQYELLKLLNASTSGHFIGVFDCLGPADISFAHQEALGPLGVAGCHGLVMVAGGADMNRRIGYAELCIHLPHLLNITVLRCSDMDDGERFLAVFAAIRAVAVLHSKAYSWLDVKPANFVSMGTNFVAIDLEGVADLLGTVPTSSSVGLAMA